MADIYPPTVQRPALLKLVEALGCQERHLRRDECGDWQIAGETGHIYAVPGSLDRPKTEGFQVFVFCDTVRQWSAAKSQMKPFTDKTNDGDSEGAFFLDRLPTNGPPDEAEIIRRYVGLRKRREDSEETIAAVKERTGNYRFQAKRAGSEEI
jgi:hypothetical protein